MKWIVETLRRAVGQLPYLWRTLGLIWQAAHGWVAVWALLLVLQGFLPVAVVYLTRLLVNSLVNVAGKGVDWAVLQPVLAQAGLMAGVLALKEVLSSAASVVRIAQAELVRDYMSGLIYQKSLEVDLSLYDSPGYYDQLYRARTGASFRTLGLLESLGVLAQNGITLVSMMVVLLPYGVWLPVGLLVSMLPAFYVVLQNRLQFHRWTVKNTENERRTWYFDWLLTDRDSAAELRLFSLSEYFQDAFQTLRKSLRGERIQLARAQSGAEILAGSMALLVTGGAMAWMAWRVLLGQATLGDMALFYQAFSQGQSLMRVFLENMGEIYTSSFFLTDLFKFLEIEARVQEPEHPLSAPERVQKHIRLQGVSFSYPDSPQPTLQDFNLTIQAGSIAAIVGVNGAGKSTLVKLLCRFYDPQSGVITIDDADLRQFGLDDLRSKISVLFQSPVHYSATARENIEFGNWKAAVSEEQIWQAADAAGADGPIRRLPQGYATMLGRWFKDGADLSVGEWQRVALGRAFLRKAPIMILDEPTSAMDPWAEADWLARFRKLAAGRTAILITHRFTTAAYADRIYLMDAGKIVEAGSHEELLAACGRYAVSWNEQMSRWLDAAQARRGVDDSA